MSIQLDALESAPSKRFSQRFESLPDDCSVEDIQYEVYVRHAIEKGEEVAASGQTVPHEQVMRETAEWLKK